MIFNNSATLVPYMLYYYIILNNFKIRTHTHTHNIIHNNMHKYFCFHFIRIIVIFVIHTI